MNIIAHKHAHSNSWTKQHPTTNCIHPNQGLRLAFLIVPILVAPSISNFHLTLSSDAPSQEIISRAIRGEDPLPADEPLNFIPGTIQMSSKGVFQRCLVDQESYGTMIPSGPSRLVSLSHEHIC